MRALADLLGLESKRHAATAGVREGVGELIDQLVLSILKLSRWPTLAKPDRGDSTYQEHRTAVEELGRYGYEVLGPLEEKLLLLSDDVTARLEEKSRAREGTSAPWRGKPKKEVPADVRARIIHFFNKGTKSAVTVHGLVDGPAYKLTIKDVGRTIASYARQQRRVKVKGNSARTKAR